MMETFGIRLSYFTEGIIMEYDRYPLVDDPESTFSAIFTSNLMSMQVYIP